MSKQKRKGFSVAKPVAVLVLLALIAAGGMYGWHRYQTRTDTQGAVNTHAYPPDWLEYSSTHSSIRFAYPASWQLAHNAIPNGGTTLEDVSLKGPNNFLMRFLLEKTHVNPGAACVLSHYGPTAKLNSRFTVASLLDSKNRTTIDSLSLVPARATNITQGNSGCAPSFSVNPAGKDVDFSFIAMYAQNSDSNIPAPKAAASYFTLPEVRTAQTIFSSVH